MEILITICARGGSKGIPGKNIKVINEKPLIYYTLKTANAFKEKYKGKVDIVLSTDSQQIKDVVERQGLYIETDYTRPEALATDTAGKLGVIIDVKNFMEQKHHKKYDYVLDMDVTAPLRNVADLEKALVLLERNAEAYNVFSVSPCHRNPYFNMVEENKEGFYELCKKGSFLTRQSAPKVFDMNASFYYYKRAFFDNHCEGVITDKSLVYEVPHLCFDLDEPIDFEFMSFLLTQKKLDFDFNY
ncbi:cytidylyltransferase [Capnocytophaga sp. oral taxon 412 str. F0487]|uniref:acylneuraminate cytidylyltransferase family protein n=1 Tax=Capnocytophaga sp. oral taxon 412 TaxID=712218 RepID=UPI00026964F3|nr:acylneuraminate cytidylyltransferase family protein [Capnocytophaga sp. oral taxon 412]EIW91181.1 cytidylyltransferase [Capnocytophaga sp. oral taxon 412 str. F0487]